MRWQKLHEDHCYNFLEDKCKLLATYLNKSSFISLMQRLLWLATMSLNFRKALPRKMADCTSEEIENDDKILYGILYSHWTCIQAKVYYINTEINTVQEHWGTPEMQCKKNDYPRLEPLLFHLQLSQLGTNYLTSQSYNFLIYKMQMRVTPISYLFCYMRGRFMVPCKIHNIFATNIHYYCSGGRYILNKYTFLLLTLQSLSNLSYPFSSHRIHNSSVVK